MSKITIQNADEEIAKRLRACGLSSKGNQYLRAANILDEAGVIDHLITMYDRGLHKQTSLLDMLEKAVNIGRIISGDASELPDTDKNPADNFIDSAPQPAPKFGA